MTAEDFKELKQGDMFGLGTHDGEDYVGVKTAKGMTVFKGPSVDSADSPQAHFQLIRDNGANVGAGEASRFQLDDQLKNLINKG